MSQGPAPDEVRDTLVPTDALPAKGVRDTLVPEDAQAVEAQPPEPVLRPDPDRHARPGLALGGGIALLVVAAGIAPVLLVAWLAWPHAVVEGGPATAAAETSFEKPRVDFAALRAAIPAATVAAAPSPGPAAADAAPRVEPDPSLRAFARLANRVYDAREVWRKAGQSGRELFRTATLDELGGAAFVEELQLSPRRFVWLRREARVLAPAAAQEEPQVIADQAPRTSAASPRAIDDAFMDLMSRVRRDPSATSATPLIATTPPASQTRSGEINDEFNKLLGSARTKG